MKSRLRSRWYRPNEKPLETSSGGSKNQEPFGEISATDEKLVDDLTNAKPPQQSVRGKGPRRRDKTSHENNNERQRSRKPRNHNRDSREKDQRDSTKQKDGSFSERESNERNNSNPKNRKPRRRKNKKRNEQQGNEKKSAPNLREDKTKEAKKSGISGFISKLFGS